MVASYSRMVFALIATTILEVISGCGHSTVAVCGPKRKLFDYDELTLILTVHIHLTIYLMFATKFFRIG
jgi:hypothetical protein